MIERLGPQGIDEIDRIMREPDIWPQITDDGSLYNLNHLSLIMRVPNIYFLVPIVNSIRVGVFFLHPHNTILFELHSMVKRENRGRLVTLGLLEVGEFMFNHTPCEKIITLVPEGNYRARFMAQFMGMKHEGVNRWSIKKDGRLLHQHSYGVCKKEFNDIQLKIEKRVEKKKKREGLWAQKQLQ